MSCYEWERGEIVIPQDQWPKFKETIREEYNRQQEARYTKACRLHEQLVAQSKGKRGFDFAAALERLLDHEEESWVFSNAILPSKYDQESRRWTRAKRPLKPLKKNFALANSSTKQLNLHAAEATIAFDDKKRMLRYSVGENNHACERAHEDPVVNVMFRALDRVRWTRGSGGTIIGNDEYNRDNDHAGGGGNYIKQSFGPAGDEAQAWAGQFVTASAIKNQNKLMRSATKKRTLKPVVKKGIR